MAKTTYESPQRITIIAGPTFGQAFKFMLFGAAVGGAGVYFLLNPKTPPAAFPKTPLKDVAAKYEAAIEDFSVPDEVNPSAKPSERSDAAAVSTTDISERLGVLASRLKSLGARGKVLVESASEAVKPALENAIAEGKKAAAEVQTMLKKDVDDAGDGPAIAKQDGDLPSEKEEKFVE